MTEAERIAQSIEVWTGGHPAAALLRQQAAEIERLREALKAIKGFDPTTTSTAMASHIARAALENNHD